jgi:translation initiation factor 2A
MWNAPSTACLVMATCETDATNQSYYGESKLHYLPAEAGKGDAACSVALPKDGPVHDVQWSPAGDFFVVIAGFMPAKVGTGPAAAPRARARQPAAVGNVCIEQLV